MDLAAPPTQRTVTFLFTAIEESTRLWEQRTTAMRADLSRHDALLHQLLPAHGGHVFKTIGDAFCAAFPTTREAVQAARAAQEALRRELPQLRVRMAVHTGEAEARDGDYFGPALNRVARLLIAGHGGQILLSQAAAEQLREALPADTHLQSMASIASGISPHGNGSTNCCCPGSPPAFPRSIPSMSPSGAACCGPPPRPR
jgi:class 3 adenylate cyclase